MAEIKLSILSRQCLNQRFASADALDTAVHAWAADRHQRHQLAIHQAYDLIDPLAKCNVQNSLLAQWAVKKLSEHRPPSQVGLGL